MAYFPADLALRPEFLVEGPVRLDVAKYHYGALYSCIFPRHSLATNNVRLRLTNSARTGCCTIYSSNVSPATPGVGKPILQVLNWVIKCAKS